MIVVNPSYEILWPERLKDAAYRCEYVARTCYKSQDHMKSGSDVKMVKMLYDRLHHAMLEFTGDIWVKFVADRGFSHELVRHREDTSYAQESTRYCNYSKGKFGGQLTVVSVRDIIDMRIEDKELCAWTEEEILDAYEFLELKYIRLTSHGVPAEIARQILPIGIKTEIVIKAGVREWMHVFKMRCDKKAHPRMRQLMIPLLHECKSLVPVVFDELCEKYPITS